MFRTFALALTIVTVGGVGGGNLTPPAPLSIQGEGSVQRGNVIDLRREHHERQSLPALAMLAAKTTNLCGLNTSSTCMERGPGGEVSALTRHQQPQVEKGSKPAAPPPVAAKTVTVKTSSTLTDILAEVTKQSGLTLDASAVDGTAKVNVNFNNTPFWAAVEAVADQANCFVSVAGTKVKLTKRPNGVGAVPSGIDGPFRVVVKRVTAKRDPEQADAEYEIHLEVQWEPRFPVYLIDGEPTATAVAGKQKLAANAPSVRVIPTGHTHAAVVKLKNVPREAKQLDELACSFRVVAAAKVLAVEFKDLTADKPVSQTVDGVTVTLQPVKGFDKRVEFGVTAEYPDGHPEFESFQLWHATNAFRLFPPNDRTGRKPTDLNLGEGGRRVSAEYHFARPAGTTLDLKGWRAVYETPGPMSEQTLKVTLKGVVLP
jgi:hypothetical protein